MAEAYVIWAVILYILTLALISVVLVRRRKPGRTMQDFFLAGRDLGPIAMPLTLFATLFSAFTVVGMPGFFYSYGVGAWAFAVFGDLLIPFVIFFFGIRVIRLGRNLNLSSPIELLTHMYESKLVNMLAVLITVVFMLPYFALQIAGMGKLLSSASGGLVSYWVGAGLMLLAMVIYSVIGGLRADVWTDILQGVVTLVIVLVVAVGLVSIAWNGSLAALFQGVVDRGRSDLLSIPGPTGYFSRRMLISFLFLFLLIPVTQPQLNVRFYAARSERALMWTMAVFPLLTLLMFAPAVVIGLGGAALFDLPSGDLVTMKVLKEFFHPVLAAALAIGFLAAAMSTSDSILLALGSIFARDIYVPYFQRDAGEQQQLRVARVFMLVLMVGGFVLALDPPGLIAKLAVLSIAGTAVLGPTFLGPVVFGIRSSSAALSSMIVGSLVLLFAEVVIPRSYLFGFHPGFWAVICSFATYFLAILHRDWLGTA